MSIMDTFERDANGYPEYVIRQDLGVTIYVARRSSGYECFFSDGVPSMSVIDSIKDTPEEALLNALTWRLAPVAVMEEWTMPHLCGLRACCEDVVNWLGFNVAKAAEYGLDEIVYNTHSTTDFELVDRCMGIAIEHMRKHASDYGIEFTDVWTEA